MSTVTTSSAHEPDWEAMRRTAADTVSLLKSLANENRLTILDIYCPA